MRLIKSVLPMCLVLAAGGALPCLAAGPADMEDPYVDRLENAETLQPRAFAARKAKMLAGGARVAAAAEKAPEGPKVVVVDCDKGKSVQEALDSNAGPVVVEIHGLCHENVTVRRRDNLVIRGIDPEFDGIRGVATESFQRGVLDIHYSDQVRIENLSLNDTPPDGPFAALNLEQSIVTVENSQFDGNARRGVNIRGSSEFDGFGLTISNNGQNGLGANRNSTALCTGCTLENNAVYAAVSSWGSIVTLLQSVVTGPRGIASSVNAYIDIDCYSRQSSYPQYPDCSLDVADWAAVARWGSEAVLYVSGPFTGVAWASEQSKIWLYGAEQQYEGPRANDIWDTSELRVDAAFAGGGFFPAELVGQTRLHAFSRALLQDQASLNGELLCNDAADAWADGTVTYAGGSSVAGCEHLPWPPPGP